MYSIFNFFRSGGAYSKSTTEASSSSATQSSQKDEMDTTITTTKLTENNNSSSDEEGKNKEQNIEINNNNNTTKELTSSSTSSSQIIESLIIEIGKSLIPSIQMSGDSPPQYYETDLQDLMKLKEHLQYKPTVLNLVAVYQTEIQKHVEFGESKKKLKNRTVLNYQIEPTPTHNVIQKKQLELLEKEYTKIMREKEKILWDRASILSSDELAIIEEEEGQGRRSNQDEDEWEIERKRRILENERKLIEKGLAESKKHRNVRFYCKGELEYLSKWNDHFTKTNNETTTPKGLEELLRFRIAPNNRFDLGAEEIHFRFCESQFHRLATGGMYPSNYPNARVVNVDYVVNPVIMKRFNARKKELAEKHGFMIESMKPLLLFHGTNECSMENILKTNFLLDRIGSTTDMGYYGKGFYFSEYPGLSMAYSENEYLLICMVLIGKAFHMDDVDTGRAIEPGYDSHVSPDGCSEVIIFDPDQIIPLYKIQWAQN